MLTKRIIPCLDILDNRVVKGTHFENLRDVGDPIEMAAKYYEEGADELVLLDVSASLEGRKPFYSVVEQVAKEVAIPLTVGGGIRTVEDITQMLLSGADKVSLNTVLTENIELLDEAAPRVGSQALVAAIDAKWDGNHWFIKVRSGKQKTNLDAIEWAKTVVAHGAGEILVTSIDKDGTKSGYDCAILKRLNEVVRVPIVASGGAGSKEHILEALDKGQADAVLAASIFHFNEIPVPELKEYLHQHGVPVRI